MNRIKITGSREGKPLMGQDVKVELVTPAGTFDIPCFELSFSVGARHHAEARLVVPVHVLELAGITGTMVPLIDGLQGEPVMLDNEVE